MSPSETLWIGIFCRCFAFFLISPFFSKIPIPKVVRFGIAVAMTIVLIPLVGKRAEGIPTQGSLWILWIVKEAVIGYFMGLVFSLLLESAALAGQILGTLAGFSATELLTPQDSPLNPLWSRLMTFFVAVLIFSLDLHHQLLWTLYDSFAFFPFSNSLFSISLVDRLLEAVHLFFQFALHYAFLPLIALTGITLLLGITTKLLPDFPIFWMGFPIQILIGLLVLILSAGYFKDILEQAFLSLTEVLGRFFFETSSFL